MTSSELLIDAFGRIRDGVHAAVEGLSAPDLAHRPAPDANSVAWLVWHLTRIQDDHLADVMGTEQVWTAAGWYDRFDLPFGPQEHGYGHTAEQVAAVRPSSPDLLTGYHDAVHAATVGWLAGIGDDDLPRVVDDSWDPPVTLAVRLISVVSDDLQHVGQAAYVAGLIRG
jgi:hypothetical protein